MKKVIKYLVRRKSHLLDIINFHKTEIGIAEKEISKIKSLIRSLEERE